MYKEYWIYQKHIENKKEPWAICIGRTYSARNKTDQTLEITIYSEDIQTATKSICLEDRRYSSISECVQAIKAAIQTFSNVSEFDEQQIQESIERILLD